MAEAQATLNKDTATVLALGGDVGDYWQLMKPRVMSLVVFTALVGMAAAPGGIHPVMGFVALLFIAIGAGASGALNMWYDADIDAVMQRTRGRPIPAGRLDAGAALVFGSIMAGGAVLCLGVLVNWVAGSLLALTIAYYVFFYTMGLKRRTPQNIVIGGAAGAFPPMIGWAAVTGSVGVESIVLFLIIFMWTPPHFWALALYRCNDYEKAQVPMLPVVAGPDETRRQILIYSLILVPLTFVPLALAFAGLIYGLTALGMGGAFLWFALRVYRDRAGELADISARRLFGFSILYLFSLYLALLVEHGVGLMVPIGM